MAVIMAAKRICLTTVVILLTVFCIFYQKMANISIILTNDSAVKVPKSYSLAWLLKTNFFDNKCVCVCVLQNKLHIILLLFLLLFPLQVSMAVLTKFWTWPEATVAKLPPL